MEENEIDALINRARAGDAAAFESLVRLTYAECRRVAGALMWSESQKGRTLQATALVHEAIIRLVKRAPKPDEPIRDYLALARNEMRWILASHAKRRNRRDAKSASGVDVECVSGRETGATTLTAVKSDEIGRAMVTLWEMSDEVRPAMCPQVAWHVLFQEMSMDETAALLGISVEHARDLYATARAHFQRLFRSDGCSP